MSCTVKHLGSYIVISILAVILFAVILYARLAIGNLLSEAFQSKDVGLGLECKAEGNLTGVCTKIADCPLVNFNVSASKICSYDGKVLIICCVRTSELACNGYNIVNGSLLKKSEENTNNNTVIKIQHRQYPRIVTIGWTQDDGNIRWNCRGSLISDRYLIASAQCSTFEGIAPDKISVRTENSSADLGEGLRTESNISSIIVHPDYKALSKYHDIALFKIDPIENLSALMPICLWPSKKLPFSAPLSMIFSEAGLHETSVSSVLQHSCARSFTLPIKSIPDGLIHSQICVQAKDRTLDICDDPNDGLLQLHTISSIADSAEYLVAVAPFDATCSQSTKMFTRIQSYLDWIEPIVWPEYYS